MTIRAQLISVVSDHDRGRGRHDHGCGFALQILRAWPEWWIRVSFLHFELQSASICFRSFLWASTLESKKNVIVIHKSPFLRYQRGRYTRKGQPPLPGAILRQPCSLRKELKWEMLSYLTCKSEPRVESTIAKHRGEEIGEESFCIWKTKFDVDRKIRQFMRQFVEKEGDSRC